MGGAAAGSGCGPVVGAEPGGGAGRIGAGSGGRAGRRGRRSGATHAEPTQISPDAHGGTQTDGSLGSGSAPRARPAAASTKAAAITPGDRVRAPIPSYYSPSVSSLRAPIAVPVEIRAPTRRVFRLAAAVGEDGVRLARGASFEPGRPVDIRFALPDGGGALALPAIVGEGQGEDDELGFVDPPAEAREAIRRYVHGRLGLPK